jgi:hypothetical protein
VTATTDGLAVALTLGRMGAFTPARLKRTAEELGVALADAEVERTIGVAVEQGWLKQEGRLNFEPRLVLAADPVVVFEEREDEQYRQFADLLGIEIVHLADPDGPTMRIEETWVRHAADTPKSQAGHRTIALGRKLADELWQHRQRTPFAGDDERVFANPRTGRPFGADRYAEILRMALDKVGIEERIRPSHDLRHSSITNAAAAGTPPTRPRGCTSISPVSGSATRPTGWRSVCGADQ